jgi:Flp pilus assembly protein TadD
VRLDSTIAEPHTTLGLLHRTRGEWDAAERAFRRALSLDSTSVTALHWYGELLVVVGRLDEAIALFRRAERLDPLQPLLPAALGYILALDGNFDEAYASGRRAQELAPGVWTSHAFLGCAYIWAGRHGDAVRELERALAIDPGIPFGGALAYAYGAAGRTDDARRLLETLEAGAKAGRVLPSSVALAHLGVGDRDQALAWLARAAEIDDPFLTNSGLLPPWYDSVRDDPRFAEAARRLGLPERAWRRTGPAAR